MNYQFKLPDIGEGIAEGEIVQWLVKEGDTIQEDDALLEVQNDKSVEEIPSPVTGTVKKIIVQEGQVASVGDVLVEIETDHAPAGHHEEQATVEEDKLLASEAVVTAPKAASKATVSAVNKENILAMPSVRKFARENDVDLSKVTATGRGGRITKEDVEMYMNGGEIVAKETATVDNEQVVRTTVSVSNDSNEEVREKMTPTRKAIAKAMVQSKHTAPHVTLFDEVEVSALWEHRQTYKVNLAEDDIKLTFLPYVVKALTLTMKKFPILNASIDDDTQEIVYKHYYNIGIATDTDHGLYVPTIKHADRLGLASIAKNIQDNTAKAMEGTLSAEDMSGGTVSITNIGSIGGGFFTPVINYPEVAILGLGTITKQPIVNDNDDIVVGRVMKLSLSFDHRIVDGGTAQRAMNYLKSLLHDPQLLLMEG